MVFDQSDVLPMFLSELDVGALEEIEYGRVKATFCRERSVCRGLEGLDFEAEGG